MSRLEAVTRIFTGISRQREITPSVVKALNKESRKVYQRSLGDHSMQYIRGFEITPGNVLLCHTDVSPAVWNSSLSTRVNRGCAAEQVLRNTQFLQPNQYIETVPVQLNGLVALAIKIKSGQKPPKDADLYPEINLKGNYSVFPSSTLNN